MSSLKKVILIPALLTLSTAAVQAQTIDSFDFGVATTVVTANFFTGPTSSAAVGSHGSILGTERDMEVMATTGATDVMLDGGGGSSFLLLSAGFAAKGIGRVVWDGADGNATTIDCTTGLGGFDLTFGGDTLLRLKTALSDKATDVTFTVYTDCTNFSSLTMTLPALTPIANFDFPFASFVTGGGAGATFTNVNALVLEIDGTLATATDFSADFVTTPVELESFSVD